MVKSAKSYSFMSHVATGSELSVTAAYCRCSGYYTHFNVGTLLSGREGKTRLVVVEHSLATTACLILQLVTSRHFQLQRSKRVHFCAFVKCAADEVASSVSFQVCDAPFECCILWNLSFYLLCRIHLHLVVKPDLTSFLCSLRVDRVILRPFVSVFSLGYWLIAAMRLVCSVYLSNHAVIRSPKPIKLSF